MKSEFRNIVFFGIALALLFGILKFFEYKYFVGSLSQDVYTTVIAILFTGLGIWLGLEFFNKKAMKSDETPPELVDKELFSLNDREFEILALIAEGHTNQSIADQLFIALPTVKTHVSNLYSKLEVNNRTQAVNVARKVNLIT
jgi:DNA-binding CsgD family transcriptional regulator